MHPRPFALVALLFALPAIAVGNSSADVDETSPNRWAAPTYPVFAEYLNYPFNDWSYGMHNLYALGQAHTGNVAARLDPSAMGGLKFHAVAPVALAPYGALELWLYGVGSGRQSMGLTVTDSAGNGKTVDLGAYTTIGANTWSKATVPFADLALSGGNIVDIDIHGQLQASQAQVLVDDLSLVPAPTKSLVIYSDSPQNGFSGGGWGAYSISQSTQVHTGQFAAALPAANWNGVQFLTAAPIDLTAAGYTSLTFWVHGGSGGGQHLWAGIKMSAAGTFRVLIGDYLPAGIVANTWSQVTIPMADFKLPASTATGFYVMDALGQAQPTAYLDDFALVGGSAEPTPTPTPSPAPKPSPSPSPAPKPSPTPAPAPADCSPSGGWLYTYKNHIYKCDGTLFLGRGANIADPRGCGACASSNLTQSTDEVIRRIDLLVDGWHANFMRLDLESYASGAPGVLASPAYLQALQRIVAHVQTKPGVYLELSVWVDPSLDGRGWPTDATNQIWTQLATTFAGNPQVLFGISNEPTLNYDGADDATVWQRMNSAASVIRAAERAYSTHKHIVLAQGTGGWARFLAYYEGHPLTAGDGSNFAYEVHVYDTASTFNDRFITPSKTIPVVIGEYGPASGAMTLSETALLMTQAEAQAVPYMAWTFHMRCPPNLLVDNSGNGCGLGMTLAPTDWGKQLQTQLAKPWQTNFQF